MASFWRLFMAVLGITLSFAGTVSSQEPMAFGIVSRRRSDAPWNGLLDIYYPDLDPGGGVGTSLRTSHHDGLVTVFGLETKAR